MQVMSHCRPALKLVATCDTLMQVMLYCRDALKQVVSYYRNLTQVVFFRCGNMY